MAILKSSLTILVVNLILIRLTLANSQSAQLENINSLDFSSSSILATSSTPSSIDTIFLHNANKQDDQQQHDEKVSPTTKPAKKSRSQKSLTTSSAIYQVLGSLDKLDFKSLAGGVVKSLSGLISNNKPINKRSHGNHSEIFNHEDDKSSLGSMASQLMRLARGHEHNWEFDHAASAKSDWFWLVVPAVIVVGAGIIILPLIAACFVSMLTSGSYTLSTGRKKRDVNDEANQPHFGRGLLDMYKTMSSNQDFVQQLIGDLAQFDKALSNVEMFLRSDSYVSNKDANTTRAASKNP